MCYYMHISSMPSEESYSAAMPLPMASTALPTSQTGRIWEASSVALSKKSVSIFRHSWPRCMASPESSPPEMMPSVHIANVASLERMRTSFAPLSLNMAPFTNPACGHSPPVGWSMVDCYSARMPLSM